MAKQVYQCEYCGMLHTTKANAEKCEASHIIVKKVKKHVYDFSDKSKYPMTIKCEMSNGKVVFYHRVMKFPSVDVEPVKHGYWIINSDGYYPQCSECLKEPKGREMTECCPHCGAKMDGGKENG